MVGVAPVIDKAELQYQAMVLLSRLVKFNDVWLSTQAQLVKQLLDIWISDAFVQRHAKVVSDACCFVFSQHVLCCWSVFSPHSLGI